MENLNKEEVDFVIDALNAYWNKSHDMLTTRNNLGDIQIKNLKENKEKSREIMKKLGCFN